jgi:hypothetical protein
MNGEKMTIILEHRSYGVFIIYRTVVQVIFVMNNASVIS